MPDRPPSIRAPRPLYIDRDPPAPTGNIADRRERGS
jgi:hypothetical protein